MTSLIRSLFLAAAVCLAILTTAAMGAQLSGTLSGPVLGYMFDSNDGKLRPLLGILGSTTVGTPVELGFTPSLVLTLDAMHIIASTDAGPEFLVVGLESGPPSTTVISGVSGKPALAAVSLQGTAAAFYYADVQEVRIVTGLPQKPALSNRITLSQLGRPLTHMALSNDGALLVYSIAEGEGDALFSWSASSDRDRFLMAAGSISSVAITGNGAAIVADRGANEVFAIWDLGGAAIPQFLAGPGDGVSDPVGLASDANRIYISNAGSGTVIALDSNGRYLQTLDCNCTLTGAFALRDSVFRLTDRVHRTIFLLDASSPTARILFAPPPKD